MRLHWRSAQRADEIMKDQNDSGSGAKSNPAARLWILVLAGLIGFGAVYVMRGAPDNAAVSEAGAPKAPEAAAKTGQMAAFVKKKAPEALPEITFNDAGGKTLTLADFKGKTILLNLWATWCAPCREEMPSLDRLQKALGSDKFEVVALSLDRKGAEAAKKFLDEAKVTSLKLYIDATAKQGTTLRVIGMPTTLLIDQEGREIGRLTGPAEWDSEEAKKLIEAALK
jgi:thiol-disulfide isomerase/thioredoxin